MTLHHPAMLTVRSLLVQLRQRQADGEKIVFTNGCFDILHPGHVDLLARARAEGDFLVLGLNSDNSVRRQNKGPDRPINTYAARAFVLAHLACVDAVVPFDDDTPEALIEVIAPDVLVKGGDWTPDRIVGAASVTARGGRVLSLPLIQGFSTTQIITDIRKKS